jgi:pimeloyl-ACP methyl ester carboxylesterase
VHDPAFSGDDRITFVLVHGAWHGGWCWQHLAPHLEQRGARSIAVDLPCDDVEAGTETYAAHVLEALPVRGDLVLVGHSLGGLTIPLVAATRPVRALVFLCALLPVPGLSVVDQLRLEPEMFAAGFGSTLARDARGRSYWGDRDEAIAQMYGDVDTDEATWAFTRLRPQARLPSVEPSPLRAWPDAPSVVIVARDDLAIAPSWSHRSARERLGIEALELPCSHSPFMSQPASLAELLLFAVAGLERRAPQERDAR